MTSLRQEVLDVVDEVQIFVTSECHQKSVTNFDLVLKILYKNDADLMKISTNHIVA